MRDRQTTLLQLPEDERWVPGYGRYSFTKTGQLFTWTRQVARELAEDCEDE